MLLTFQTPFVRLWHGQTHHLKLLFKSNLILSCHFLIRSRVTIKVLASRARAVDDLINALHSTIVNYDFRVVLTANFYDFRVVIYDRSVYKIATAFVSF